MKQSSPSPKATVQLEILLSDSCEILGGNECRMCRLLYVGFSTRWICRSQSSQAHQPSGYSSLNKHKSNQFETTWSHSTFFLFFAFCFHFVSISFPFFPSATARDSQRCFKMLQDSCQGLSAFLFGDSAGIVGADPVLYFSILSVFFLSFVCFQLFVFLNITSDSSEFSRSFFFYNYVIILDFIFLANVCIVSCFPSFPFVLEILLDPLSDALRFLENIGSLSIFLLFCV